MVGGNPLKECVCNIATRDELMAVNTDSDIGKTPGHGLEIPLEHVFNHS